MALSSNNFFLPQLIVQTEKAVYFLSRREKAWKDISNFVVHLFSQSPTNMTGDETRKCPRSTKALLATVKSQLKKKKSVQCDATEVQWAAL